MVFEKKIGECCQVGDGTHSTITRQNNGILYLSAKNFKMTGLNLDNVDFISIEDYQKHFRENSKALTKPRTGDLIFSIIGSLGGAYLYSEDDNFGISSSVAILRPDSSKLDSRYLLYYLKSEYLQKWVESIKSGAAQSFLSLEMIKYLPVKFESDIVDQKKIASILSAYDDLIENNNQRIKLLEEIAEEIYKEWFVRMRFPGYQDTKFFDKDGKEVLHGTAGALPEGWELIRLKKHGKVITGKTPSKDDDSNFSGEIPFIKTPDMHQGIFFIGTEESLSKKGADSQSSQYIPENSISVSCIGTVGKVGISTKTSQTNQQINSLIPLDPRSLEYLYYSMLGHKPVIESYAATGATMANLSKSKFENLKILKPHGSILLLFNELAKPMFSEIKILLMKNQVLRETRDLLLPRLISGKLDVSELEMNEPENLSIAAEPKPSYT